MAEGLEDLELEDKKFSTEFWIRKEILIVNTIQKMA